MVNITKIRRRFEAATRRQRPAYHIQGGSHEAGELGSHVVHDEAERDPAEPKSHRGEGKDLG